jgi:hypothetical protein
MASRRRVRRCGRARLDPVTPYEPVLGLSGAMINAWILLIEIRR